MSFTLITIIVLALLFLFNLGLFLWLFRLSRHYNRLVVGSDQKTLMAALEGIQKTLSSHERTLASHQKELKNQENTGRLHLQKMHLKRFNPFSDTGGDQSFILSFLDGNRDGVVITSLHSRENTRFYVKEIEGGKGVKHTLSLEEQKVVNQ